MRWVAAFRRQEKEWNNSFRVADWFLKTPFDRGWSFFYYLSPLLRSEFLWWTACLVTIVINGSTFVIRWWSVQVSEISYNILIVKCRWTSWFLVKEPFLVYDPPGRKFYFPANSFWLRPTVPWIIQFSPIELWIPGGEYLSSPSRRLGICRPCKTNSNKIWGNFLLLEDFIASLDTCSSLCLLVG